MSSEGQAVKLKKEILARIIQAFLSGDFPEQARLIPYKMRPKGMDVPYRCCVYKERAVIKDRTIAGLGFPIEEDDETVSLKTYAQKALERTEISSKNLTVLQAACRGCESDRIYVTDLCRGCVARHCLSACKFGAVSIVNGRSVIDNSKCKRCRMCISACPYKAIVKITVPCEEACPVNAIKKDETGFAEIDYEKCISCGRCASVCPFGAVHERSQIIDILKALQSDRKVIAMTAPAIAGQFQCSIKQLKTAMIKSGFDDVYEAAQGADTTSHNEAAEFLERMHRGDKFMTTSCCAGYNQLIKKHLPEIKPFVSDTKTPIYYTAEIIKKDYPESVIVFASPCTAKRAEVFENPDIDYVISCEELEALFKAKEILPEKLEETEFKYEASSEGRSYGSSGGVASAVRASLQNEDEVKPVIINGLNKESIKQLKQYAIDGACPDGCNLAEVMCCYGGCIGGNTVLNSRKNAEKLLDKLAAESRKIDKIN